MIAIFSCPATWHDLETGFTFFFLNVSKTLIIRAGANGKIQSGRIATTVRRCNKIVKGICVAKDVPNWYDGRERSQTYIKLGLKFSRHVKCTGTLHNLSRKS